MVSHHGIAFQGLHQRPRQPRRDRRHQAHPPTGDRRGQERKHHDEPTTQARHVGVDLHCLAVLHHVWTADVPRPRRRHVGRGGLGQVVQHVVDRYRLDLVVHPLRCRHRGQAVGEVANHLERGGSRADHDPGLQHDGLDTRVDEDLADLGARRQMPRQLRALGMEAAEVHQSPHPRPFSRLDHIACRHPLLGDEVLRCPHRVHQVVDDVGTVEGLGQRLGRGQVAPRDLDVAPPRRGVEFVRVARHRAHLQAGVQQSRHQPPTDVAGRACHQAANLLSRHRTSVRRRSSFSYSEPADVRMTVSRFTQTRNRGRARRRTAVLPRDRRRGSAGPVVQGPRCGRCARSRDRPSR